MNIFHKDALCQQKKEMGVTRTWKGKEPEGKEESILIGGRMPRGTNREGTCKRRKGEREKVNKLGWGSGGNVTQEIIKIRKPTKF